MPRPAPTAARRGSARAWILFWICLAWAAAASAYGLSSRAEVARLNAEAGMRQALSDEKVRALTRRLVGVASHQMLEQDGLAERLADIVARQVELENRVVALSIMAERAQSGPAAPEPAARAEDPARRVPGRGGALATGTAIAAQPVREQFAQIETSLARVDADQRLIVDRLAGAARATSDRVRALLTDLRLALPPAPAPAPPRPPDPPGPAGAFARSIGTAEAALAEAGRWRALVDGVPLRPPIAGEDNTTSNFGLRKDPFTGGPRMHAGMDFRSPVGTPVRTAASGRVVTAGASGGYGNLVEIDHGHDLVTRYGHLSSIAVSVAQVVPAGSVVGLVGSTGRSTGPHLHYETRLAGNALDPARFLAAGHKLFGDARAPDRPQAAATGGEDTETAD